MIKNTIVVITLLLTLLTSAQMGTKRINIVTKKGDSIEGKTSDFKLKSEVQDIRCKVKSGIIAIDLNDIVKISTKRKEYIIANVEFDNTSNLYQKLHLKRELGYSRYFSLVKRTIYLELLVSGKKELYKSHLDGVNKFFFKDSLGNIVPLMYKRYFKVRPFNYVGPDFAMENNFYHKQLLEMVPCYDKGGKQILPIYKELNLIGYFKKYNSNNCN